MTHSELDDLFRANSDRADFSPQPGEWEEMTAMLDADERRERYKKLVASAWMVLFVALIVWGTFGAYHYATDGILKEAILDENATPSFVNPSFEKDNNSTVSEADGSSLGKIANAQAINSEPDNQQIDIQSNLPAVEDAGSKLEGPGLESTSSPAFAKTKQQKVRTLSQEIVSPAKGGSNSVETSSSKVELESSTNNPQASLKLVKNDTSLDKLVESDTQVQESLLRTNILNSSGIEDNLIGSFEEEKNNAASQLNLNKVTLIDESNQKALTMLSGNGLKPIEYSSDDEVNLTVPSILENSPLNPAPITIARKIPVEWSLGILGAGEVTSVAMSTALRWGLHGGVNVHVSPLEHWDFQLGLNYGRKLYHASKDQYHMAEGFWPGDVAAIDTESKTNFFEIPVMASYLLKGRAKPSVFISAGASTYILQREEFTYKYPMEVPGQVYNHSMKFQNCNVLAVANFQLGYRIPTSNGVAYRLSPFVQIPLQGIGYGAVDLYTGGVSFEVEF